MTTLVFVHGWSVRNTSIYGRMPQQLQQGATAAGQTLTLADIWLSEYVSFDDAVTKSDIVRAFDHALRDLHLTDASFACITHSTGGPVVRDWRELDSTESPSLNLDHMHGPDPVISNNIPLDSVTVKGNAVNTSHAYLTLTKAFQAVSRLLAFTEPRPLAKLQPGCAS
ncbi:MAG: hypothetical protein ACREPQ_18190 [Rhodanobacter sp.]